MIRRIAAVAEERGCAEIWVLTDLENEPARALYSGLGGEESEGHVMVTWALDGRLGWPASARGHTGIKLISY